MYLLMVYFILSNILIITWAIDHPKLLRLSSEEVLQRYAISLIIGPFYRGYHALFVAYMFHISNRGFRIANKGRRLASVLEEKRGGLTISERVKIGRIFHVHQKYIEKVKRVSNDFILMNDRFQKFMYAYYI